MEASARVIYRLEGVSKVYHEPPSPPTLALDRVDMEIATGEYVAVTGPSGSGKSTLLHLLGLLHQPSEGLFYFEEREISRLPGRELDRLRNTRIGFVFQDFSLLANLSVMDNVCLPLVYAAVPRARRREMAAASLERVGLGHRLGHDIRHLSGGEKQRCAIARALVATPSVILADEPTGNLDQKTGQQIIQLFDELNAQGITIVVITHDPLIAARLPIHFALADGRVVDGYARACAPEPA